MSLYFRLIWFAFLISSTASWVWGQTAEEWPELMRAIDQGQRSTVERLLARGDSVNLRDQRGWTPLILAAFKGHTEMVELLVRAGADLNVQNQDGWTALMTATFNGQKEIVRFLLDQNADLSLVDTQNRTALTLALEQGQTEIGKLLVKRTQEQVRQAPHSLPPLPNPSSLSEPESLAEEADPRAEKPPTTITLKSPEPALPADISTEQTQWNALVGAIWDGQTNQVRQILEQGVSPNLRNTEYWTPLMVAAFAGYADIVQVLLNQGAELEARRNDQVTALLLAAFKGHFDVVRMLVQRGAQVNAKDQEGWTSLMVAAFRGHTDVVRFLLHNGAELNAAQQEGDTALILATFRGHTDIVQLLLEGGAQREAQNKQNKTAVMIAEERGHADILGMLKEYRFRQTTHPMPSRGELEAFSKNEFALIQDPQASVRLQPEGSQLATLKRGTTVQKIGYRNNWTRIQLEGWVSQSLLSVPHASSQTLSGSPQIVYVKAGQTRFRQQPQGSFFGWLNGGASLELLQTKGEWVKVRLQGWIWKPALADKKDRS